MQRLVKYFNRGRALWLLLFALLLTLLILWLTSINGDKPLYETANLSRQPQQDIQMTVAQKENFVAEPDRVHNEMSEEVPELRAGQLLVIKRPSWTLNGTLLAQLNGLKVAVENGDVEAAYVLGMNLKNCYFSPVDDSGLEEKLQEAYQFKDHGVSVVNITARYDFCFGINKQQRSQFYAYLAMAASKGFVPAQEEIAMITPEQYMQAADYTKLERNDYVAKRLGFVQQQVDFLVSAAQQGSIRALIKLSQLHYAQTVGEDGRLQAYAFNQMILQLTDDNELYNRYSWFQEKAQSVFTPEEIERAVDMSEQWLKIITSNGTLYLNND